jgi:hypothetical protein
VAICFRNLLLEIAAGFSTFTFLDNSRIATSPLPHLIILLGMAKTYSFIYQIKDVIVPVLQCINNFFNLFWY